MTVAEAIRELQEQSKRLIDALDRISELNKSGRVPADKINKLISDIERISRKSWGIEKAIGEIIEEAKQ